MSKEYIINENLSISYAYNCYHIQVVDTTLILNSHDWELFKLMLLDIIVKSMIHHKEKGFLHSNDIDEILFKSNKHNESLQSNITKESRNLLRRRGNKNSNRR